jgi:hypothetical protein
VSCIVFDTVGGAAIDATFNAVRRYDDVVSAGRGQRNETRVTYHPCRQREPNPDISGLPEVVILVFTRTPRMLRQNEEIAQATSSRSQTEDEPLG